MQLKRVNGLNYEDYEIKDLDELIDLIGEECTNEFNQKKKLVQIVEELGIYDTRGLFDMRTLQLIELSRFYKNAPHLIDNHIFFDTVNILSDYEPRLF